MYNYIYMSVHVFNILIILNQYFYDVYTSYMYFNYNRTHKYCLVTFFVIMSCNGDLIF
jgi:hypothetical protein